MLTRLNYRSFLVLPLLVAGVANADVVTQLSAPNGGDRVDWSQLGGDLTLVPQNFTAVSALGLTVNGSFAGGPGGSGGGLTAVVCPANPQCSWVPSGNLFSAGETLLVSTDGQTANGPITLDFSHGVSQIGAAVQADAEVGLPGVSPAFTAQVQVFNGSTLLATFTQASNASGDEVFLGALDSTGPNITSLVYSLTVAPANGDVNDFAIGSLTLAPEPGSMTMIALAAAAALVWRFRRQRLVVVAAVLGVSSLIVFAQNPFLNPFSGSSTAPTGPFSLDGATAATATLPMALPPNTNASQLNAGLAANVTNIPLWTYAVASSRDLKTYTGLMVGRSPFNRLTTTTNVPVKVIPVAWQLQTASNGTFTFDPTLPDPCSPGNPAVDTALGLTMASPLFTSTTTYNYGGTVVGTNTQFHDAFQRANFWSAVSRTGNSYHTVMSPQVLPKVNLTATQNFWVGTVTGTSGNCTGLNVPVGVINLAAWDSFVQGTLLPAYASQGVNTSNLPLFLFYNVFLQSPFNPGGPCCILGYHSAISAGVNLVQTYSTSAYNSSGFGTGASDVAVLTHELGEWMDDPVGNNATPSWGHIGQVSGCQANLEVGDPLSGTLMPTVTLNGFAYHMQELAFFSWFFGAPSTGVNGWFSSNGTFNTSAGAVCQ